MQQFLHEYKKSLSCAVLLVFLSLTKYISGTDVTPFIAQTYDLLIGTFAAGTVKYSVLTTTEREALNKNQS